MVDKIKLYTSLPPRMTRFIANTDVGSSYLAECVKSWRRANFDVVSLNGADEIEGLARLGYDVGCRQISGSRPTINDFLNFIRDSGDPLAGIINADIFLTNDAELLDSAVSSSSAGMTIIERINIDPVNLRPNGRNCFGFDAFIFNTEPLSNIQMQEDLLVGQPWWDYWLPLAYAAAGGRLMSVNRPLLFHLDHPQKWDQGQWIANGQKTVRYFLKSTGELPDDFAAEIAKFAESSDMSEYTLGPFAHWCYAKLRAMADSIGPSCCPNSGSSLPALVAFLDNPDGRALIGELNEAHVRIDRAKNEAELRLSTFGTIEDVSQPATNLFEPVMAADPALNSRKAILARFMALNVAWIRRKWFGPNVQRL